MARPPKRTYPDVFAPIGVHIFDNDAMAEVGPLAKLLYIAAILRCKRKETDGMIGRAWLPIMCAELGIEGGGASHAEELVNANLWEARDDGKGWAIPAAVWGKWHRTKEERDRDAAKSRVNGTHGGRPKTQNEPRTNLELTQNPGIANLKEPEDKTRQEKEREGEKNAAVAAAGAKPKKQKRTEPDVETTPFPPSLESPACRHAADEWLQHRRQKREPLTDLQLAKILEKFAPLGPDRFVAAVNHSIGNGWQGLFEPDGRTAPPPKPPPDNSATQAFLADAAARDARIAAEREARKQAAN